LTKAELWVTFEVTHIFFGMYKFLRYVKPIVCDFQDTEAVPDRPGVYVVVSRGTVLYVGKATKSIRSRHSSKFRRDASMSDRRMIAAAIQWREPKLVCFPLPFGSYWIGSCEGRLIAKLKPRLNKRGERISSVISACEWVLAALSVFADVSTLAIVGSVAGVLFFRLFF
jgi:hypothetical protein